jgi:hypothetical protein
MQVVKCLLIKHSNDTSLHTLYDQRVKQEAHFTQGEHVVWRATHLTSTVESIVNHNHLFAGRCGLEHGNYNNTMPPSDFRKRCANTVIAQY